MPAHERYQRGPFGVCVCFLCVISCVKGSVQKPCSYAVGLVCARQHVRGKGAEKRVSI